MKKCILTLLLLAGVGASIAQRPQRPGVPPSGTPASGSPTGMPVIGGGSTSRTGNF